MTEHVSTLKDMLSRVHLDLNEAKRHGKAHLVELLTLQAAALTAAIAKLTERRFVRQQRVHDWCVAAFGDDHAWSVEQRGIRLAEEAIEAAQAAGCDPAMVHKLVDHVFSRPVGNIAQEIGGVGVTLLALAHAITVDADYEERREFERVLSKPLAHFAARNAAKNAAGFNVTKGHQP